MDSCTWSVARHFSYCSYNYSKQLSQISSQRESLLGTWEESELEKLLSPWYKAPLQLDVDNLKFRWQSLQIAFISFSGIHLLQMLLQLVKISQLPSSPFSEQLFIQSSKNTTIVFPGSSPAFWAPCSLPMHTWAEKDAKLLRCILNAAAEKDIYFRLLKSVILPHSIIIFSNNKMYRNNNNVRLWWVHWSVSSLGAESDMTDSVFSDWCDYSLLYHMPSIGLWSLLKGLAGSLKKWSPVLAVKVPPPFKLVRGDSPPISIT